MERSRYDRSWIVVALFILLVCITAGCTGFIPKPDGHSQAGTGQDGTKSLGKQGGGSGTVSQSVCNGGTETWQVMFSGTENTNAKSSSTTTDPVFPESSITTTTVSSFSRNLQGSFPVTVSCEKEEGGNHYFLSRDDTYPASGTYEASDHISDTRGMKDDRSKKAGYSATRFSLDISPDSWGVDFAADATATGEEKLYKPAGYEGKGDPSYSETTPVSEDGSADFGCNSDTDNGGTVDFHRDGAAYIITCRTPENIGSIGQTGETTLKVTLDPEYVHGSSTPEKTLPGGW